MLGWKSKGEKKLELCKAFKILANQFYSLFYSLLGVFFDPYWVLRQCFHGIISDNPKVVSSNGQLAAHHFIYEAMAASSVGSSLYNHVHLMSPELF